MFQFLPGIILIQLVTSGLVLATFNGLQDIQLIAVFISIALLSAILTAFWFSSIARNLFNHEQNYMMERHAKDRENILKEAEHEKSRVMNEKSQLQSEHAREREKILLDAERDKAETVAKSHQKIEKESRKAHNRANLKVGMSFAVAAGAGGFMIFSQLITVGVMFLVASGSGLSGYLLRARHDRLSRNKQLAMMKQHIISDQSDDNVAQKLLQNSSKK